MSVNAPNTTPNLRTNHVNNSLLKREEKNRIARLLTNITGRDGVWVRNKANRIEIGLRETSNYHFQVVRYRGDDGSYKDQVKVCGGWWAYYEDEVRTQVDLDDGGASTITDYADQTAAITVNADGFIFLELDTSADTLEAKFAAAIPADSTDVYRKKLATISWDSGESAIAGIQQNWRGGNVFESIGGTGENNHSWHYNATTNTITVGTIRQGDNARVLSSAITDWDATPNTITSHCYWVAVDWSDTGAYNHTTPNIYWDDGASFPAGSDERWIYEILEFDGDGNAIEHRQSDIVLPESYIPDPTGSYDSPLVHDQSTAENKWLTNAGTAYQVLCNNASGELVFDYVRAH